MRLLPRTPRETWLLAGVAWAAGCEALYLPSVAPGPDAGAAPTDPTVRIWDARTGAEVVAPRGLWGRLSSQAGDYLRRVVRFCETGTWPPPAWPAVVFTPDGKRLLATSEYHAGPPREPPTGLLPRAALWGLLVALVAWRGRRRLPTADN